MPSRKAPDEDLALLTPDERRAYDVVMAVDGMNPHPGIGETLKKNGIKQSLWARTHMKLSVARERRERKARLEAHAEEGARIHDKPHPDGIRPGDAILKTERERKQLAEARADVAAETGMTRLLKKANREAMGVEPTPKREGATKAGKPEPAPKVDGQKDHQMVKSTISTSQQVPKCADVATAHPAATTNIDPISSSAKSQLPEDIRAEAALANVLAAVRRLPKAEDRRAVLKAAMWMTSIEP